MATSPTAEQAAVSRKLGDRFDRLAIMSADRARAQRAAVWSYHVRRHNQLALARYFGSPPKL